MHHKLRYFLLASLMATLTSVSAVIRIPMFPVPITLQTLLVLLSGNLLGANWGAVSMLIYLVLGLIGVPVFAGGSGVGIIFSPTFGYLAAFPIAAYWVGKKMSGINNFDKKMNKRTVMRIWIYQLQGLLWIYVLGISHLWLIKNIYIGGDFPFPKAILLGFVVFIPGLIIKSILATLITVRLKKRLNFLGF